MSKEEVTADFTLTSNILSILISFFSL